MNESSKRCFSKLTKMCILYSILCNKGMDDSLKDVINTDTGKSIINANHITMDKSDIEVFTNIISELKDLNIVDKNKYSDEDIKHSFELYNDANTYNLVGGV